MDMGVKSDMRRGPWVKAKFTWLLRTGGSQANGDSIQQYLKAQFNMKPTRNNAMQWPTLNIKIQIKMDFPSKKRAPNRK